ncbi:MAG: hypothetical protein MK212_21580, partial [Saprospiraceae bacterium]|nr:hypothetical protein [Saprospiraceae bacterium]
MISQLRRFVSRITGFSTPIIGLSWTPDEPEREKIRALLVFLEDRRTLYNPYIMEICEHSYVSVHEIRDELTKVISQINEDS